MSAAGSTQFLTPRLIRARARRRGEPEHPLAYYAIVLQQMAREGELRRVGSTIVFEGQNPHHCICNSCRHPIRPHREQPDRDIAPGVKLSRAERRRLR